MRRENILALGSSGTGKARVARVLGLAAFLTVAFATAALASQRLEARDERGSKTGHRYCSRSGSPVLFWKG